VWDWKLNPTLATEICAGVMTHARCVLDEFLVSFAQDYSTPPGPWMENVDSVGTVGHRLIEEHVWIVERSLSRPYPTLEGQPHRRGCTGRERQHLAAECAGLTITLRWIARYT
jgi:hypothetical protein